MVSKSYDNRHSLSVVLGAQCVNYLRVWFIQGNGNYNTLPLCVLACKDFTVHKIQKHFVLFEFML